MLAWVHQAIAAEREFLEALFSMKEDGRMVGSAREFREKGKMSEEEEWTRELMDAAVGKVCVPLKASLSICDSQRRRETDYIIALHPGPSSTNSQIARKRNYGIQNCQFTAVLQDYDDKNDWRGSGLVNDFERVCLLLVDLD